MLFDHTEGSAARARIDPLRNAERSSTQCAITISTSLGVDSFVYILTPIGKWQTGLAHVSTLGIVQGGQYMKIILITWLFEAGQQALLDLYRCCKNVDKVHSIPEG